MVSKTVSELKSVPKNLGLRGYSRLRKQELIDLIEKHKSGVAIPKTVSELKSVAKNLGLRGFHHSRKQELVDLIEKHKLKDNKPIPNPQGVEELGPRTKKVVKAEKPIPAPRTKKVVKAEKPIPAPRTKKVVKAEKPIPAPRLRRTEGVRTKKVVKPIPELKDLQLSKRQKKEIANLKKKINRAKNKKNLRQKLEKKIKRLVSETPKRVSDPLRIWVEREKALKGYTISFEVGIVSDSDPLVQLQTTRQSIKDNLKKVLEKMKGFKFNETLKITFEKQKGDGWIEKTAYFTEKPQTITNEAEVAKALQKTQNYIINKIQQWISEGSGWVVKTVDGHFINVLKYKPLRGSSYISLPEELRNSAKGIINIKNKDDECFRWCHIRYLNPQKKDPQRVKTSDRAYVEKLDYSGIDFPVSVKQYNKIEKQNSLRVNVFGYEKKQPYPIYVSKEKFESQLNLLLITKDEVKHYCLIKDFNKFMYNQTKHKERKNFCMYCLQCFSSKRILEEHTVNCIEINGAQSIKMPEPGTTVVFKNYKNQLAVPFVIYADFEAITEKVADPVKTSHTKKYQKHIDCGYGYKVVCCYNDEFSKPIKIYRGEKAVYKFMEDMLEEVKWCNEIVKKHFTKPLKMTNENEKSFRRAKECHICKKSYNKNDVRVRDHCHVTGKYRGSAHRDCNLNFKLTDKIPVVFHNLRGYDSHFIMQEIGEIAKKNSYTDEKGKKHDMNINVIPNNMEKYMAFMLGYQLTFIDSFQFMSSSLCNLVKNLPKIDFKYTEQVFKDRELALMKKKVSILTITWTVSKSLRKQNFPTSRIFSAF